MKIVVIQHQNDIEGEQGVAFIEVIARCWREAGHKVEYVNGVQNNISADLALLHLNSSVVPGEYIQYAKQFPAALNTGVTDIRKHKISQILVSSDDSYNGPVIVKTDLNYAGIPEAQLYQSPIPVRRTLFYYLRRIARKSREFGIKINLIDKDTKPFVKSIYRESFQILKNKKRVPANIWSNRDWIVEKFLPETEGSQYVVRNAYFLGSKMIFYKSFSSDPIVKESEEKMGTSKVINAHEDIIQFREKIGLDYGKIDYVMHKNKPIVLDVAKTVGGAYGLDLAKFLAPGIDDYV